MLKIKYFILYAENTSTHVAVQKKQQTYKEEWKGDSEWMRMREINQQSHFYVIFTCNYCETYCILVCGCKWRACHAVRCSHTIQSDYWLGVEKDFFLVSVLFSCFSCFHILHCFIYLRVGICVLSSLLFDFTWNGWCCRLIYSTLSSTTSMLLQYT